MKLSVAFGLFHRQQRPGKLLIKGLCDCGVTPCVWILDSSMFYHSMAGTLCTCSIPEMQGPLTDRPPRTVLLGGPTPGLEKCVDHNACHCAFHRGTPLLLIINDGLFFLELFSMGRCHERFKGCL